MPPIDGLRLTVDAVSLGLTGSRLAERLRRHHIEIEFADAEYVVMMFTPENADEDYARVREAFASLCEAPGIPAGSPGAGCPKGGIGRITLRLPVLEKACSIREAVLAPSEIIPATRAAGRICAAPAVSCPPAVPIAISGERFDEASVHLMELYGIREVSVVLE